MTFLSRTCHNIEFPFKVRVKQEDELSFVWFQSLSSYNDTARYKRFCYTNKIICYNRDNKNILLQQQNF